MEEFEVNIEIDEETVVELTLSFLYERYKGMQEQIDALDTFYESSLKEELFLKKEMKRLRKVIESIEQDYFTEEEDEDDEAYTYFTA